MWNNKKDSDMNTIIVKDVLGTEVRSRISIAAIKQQIVKGERNIIDMTGIAFISRSFADELYNLEQDYNNVSFIGESENVGKMMKVVWEGRRRKRVRAEDPTTIKDFSSAENFLSFLQTI